jgi:uncharacterized protein (TIGR02246 family)
MRRIMLCGTAIAAVLYFSTVILAFAPKGNAESEIKTLEQNWQAAFQAKDAAKLLTFYVPGEKLVVFDVIPPRQYTGAEAYKKDFEELFKMIDGPLKVDISDLSVTTGSGDMAYSHSIQHLSGKTPDGKPLDFTVRVTDVYQKTGGKWLIAHEHVSVPVDLLTGAPDLQSKP